MTTKEDHAPAPLSQCVKVSKDGAVINILQLQCRTNNTLYFVTEYDNKLNDYPVVTRDNPRDERHRVNSGNWFDVTYFWRAMQAGIMQHAVLRSYVSSESLLKFDYADVLNSKST